MREIKFKGKRKDNGEWIKGDLIKFSDNEVYIFSKNDSKLFAWDDSNPNIKYDMNGFFEVIPETVGQFINYYDEDNKEIYGGDIIEFENVTGIDDGICLVIWEKDSYAYYIENDNEDLYDLFENITEPAKIRIIGNKYDDPKLLEGVIK